MEVQLPPAVLVVEVEGAAQPAAVEAPMPEVAAGAEVEAAAPKLPVEDAGPRAAYRTSHKRRRLLPRYYHS